MSPGDPHGPSVFRRLGSIHNRDAVQSKATEIGSNFGVGPVRVADDFAADYALTIDDVGFGPAVGAVELRDFLVGIADGVQIDVEAREEAAVGAGIFVDADGEDGDVGAVVMELHQGRCLLNAGRALAPPEIQQYDFAAVVGKMNGIFAVVDGEVGGHPVSIHGRRTAVARRGKCEHQQKAESDQTRKPHVSIIRSGGDRKEGWVK